MATATAARTRRTSSQQIQGGTSSGARRSALVDPAHFLLATRDSGYKTTALAVAELIDNSLQAGARHIGVEVVATSDAAFPLELRVTDDGVGMDPKLLADALTFGGSSRFDDRSSLGRYGMGLPNGALSRARRVEVYSWRKGVLNYCYLDVDELVERRLRSLPPVTAVERPSFVPQTVSGTTVRLLRCDRLGVGKVVLIAPAIGARNGVVEDGPTATAVAESVRDIVRGQLSANSSEVHLYLATPAGLALLLGNRWNRLRSTVLYEFVDGTYVPTIEVPA